ncbi:MAG TPA: hypothetical protein VNV66_07460, partial [Pilimelia sp.]|nr:hypothetical protein [Pilimelia sp.]
GEVHFEVGAGHALGPLVELGLDAVGAGRSAPATPNPPVDGAEPLPRRAGPPPGRWPLPPDPFSASVAACPDSTLIRIRDALEALR